MGLGLGLADDIDLLPGADRIELIAHFGDVAAEAFDRFDLQMARGFQRRRSDAGRRDRGESIDFLQHLVDGVKILRPIEAVR